MAAHEGSEHAERAEQRGIGEATLEQFRADVTSLSVQYMTGETFGIFREMRRVRNRILEALDRRQWPRDAAELYLLAGCLSALMAAAATNLGFPQDAEELTRSGWAYATIIDHRPLMARLRLCAAYAAYWSGRPEQSANLARSGLEYLADGQNAAQLHLFGGLASARLGDAASAHQAIAVARDARDREHRDELLEIGGEFGCSPGRAGTATLENRSNRLRGLVALMMPTVSPATSQRTMPPITRETVGGRSCFSMVSTGSWLK